MSFQQGLSGLNAMSTALNAVSNNVANASTVGYKSSNANFANLYAASLSGGGSVNAGIGVTVSTIAQAFTQGNITSTSNSLDLAINGNGFYKMQASDGSTVYTRNGQFSTDNQGYVINDAGNYLMGYAATADGTIVASDPVKLQLDTSNMAPQATGEALGGNATMELQLDSEEDVIDTATFPFVATDTDTYTYSTAMTIYDTLGVDHTLTTYYVKSSSSSTDGSTWEVWATLDGDADSAAMMGTLLFDTSGKLTGTLAADGTDQSPVTVLELPTASADGDAWTVDTGAADMGYDATGAALPNWKMDFDESTAYGGDSTVNAKSQGGYAQGNLSSYSVGSDGIIQGNYSNGESKILGQVVLTVFPNNNGLQNVGNNLWVATAASGEGLDGTPGAGARGVLQSSAVEDSNVDLTTELVNMITLQRNYQANSQSIKTQDEMMQVIVNLK